MRLLASMLIVVAACDPVTPKDNGGDGDCPAAVGSGSAPLIDDLEDGNGAIEEEDGRIGEWFVFNDGTGDQTPSPDGPVLPEEGGGADESEFGMRTLGNGFSDFGATLGVLLHDNDAENPCPYDAGAYAGISFKARFNNPDTETVIRMQVNTLATTETEFGGECTSGCGDHHGILFTLTDVYDTFEFEWDELEQIGFADEQAFDEGEILSIGFSVEGDFDFSIDDLSFLE